VDKRSRKVYILWAIALLPLPLLVLVASLTLDADSEQPLWLTVIGVPSMVPYMVGFWCGYTRILARSSGWTQLARHWDTADIPSGMTFRGCTVWFDPLSSYSLKQLTLSDEGLYLRVAFFLRPFHPSVLIPWSNVKHLGPSAILLDKGEAFALRSSPRVRIRVYSDVGKAILQHLEKDKEMVALRAQEN
jgi:hypothetical protein